MRECEEYDEKVENDYDFVIYVDHYIDEEPYKRGVYFEVKTEFLFDGWVGERFYAWLINYDVLLKFIDRLGR